MRAYRLLSVLSVVFMCLSVSPRIYAATSKTPPSFKKVMYVVLENTSYDEALRQPFISKLIQQGASFSNFMAESHPSQPNYIAMIAGDTLGVMSDSNINLNANHLGDLLEAKSKTWKVYAEDFPGNCFTGAVSGLYVRKHVPFMSFTNVQKNSSRCANIVEAGALAHDIANNLLPDFSMYIPNLNNDGHDTGPSAADRWLEKEFARSLADPRFMKDMLFIVTFDESDNFLGLNKVFTVFVGPSVVPGSTVSASTNHYSILRLIEDNFQLGNLGRRDASAPVIQGIWQ